MFMKKVITYNNIMNSWVMFVKDNFKKFILLWLGELISSVGGGLTSFGLGVYIFQKTGSASSMALITLLGFIPTLLLSVPAGVLADKYDRRLLMILGDGLSAFGVVFILICMLSGGASLFQICVGVFISAIFSSLLEPSYRATITDLLTKEEFSKASGLVSLAGSSRYLLSPIIAGFLLSISSINTILIIDICTFFLTITTTLIVRKNIKTKQVKNDQKFFNSLKEGWNTIRSNKGIFTLVLISSVITLFMGAFQILVEPLVLSFTSSKILGITETICACGMLVSGIILGIFGIKKNYIKVLSIALALAGLFIFGFGLFENIIPITIFGFLFFAMLPFANNSLDYLTRTNIPDELQGRVWGLIGFISQLGYVVAYALSGVSADALGKVVGSVGRGSAIVIEISGLLLLLISIFIPKFKSLKNIEPK